MIPKADKAAGQMEALDWEVDFLEDDNALTLMATREGGERVELTWHGNRMSTGWFVPTSGDPEPLPSVVEALKRMALPSAAMLGAVSPAEALAALEGRTVYWNNSISGALEQATLPRTGQQTIIRNGQLHFASVDGGFRSVRLDSISRVG